MRLDKRNINSPENEIKGKFEFRHVMTDGGSFGRRAGVYSIYRSATHLSPQDENFPFLTEVRRTFPRFAPAEAGDYPCLSDCLTGKSRPLDRLF
jgi:hypothetical protein